MRMRTRAVASLSLAALLFPASARATTFYVAPFGADTSPGTITQPWRTIGKAATTLAPGDTVLIRAGTYAEQVQVTVSGTEGAEVTFAAYPGESPVLDGTSVVVSTGDLAGLFEVVQRSWVRVRGLKVQHAGPGELTAGFLVEDSSHVTVESCSTFDTVSSGIGVWGGSDVTLAGNDVAFACTGPMQESISVGGTTGFELRGNVVRDGPPMPAGKEGICIKDGSNTGTVHHNQVSGLHEKVGLYLDAWDKHTFDIEVHGNRIWAIEGADGIALASEMGGLLESIRVHDNVSFDNGYYGIAVGVNGTSPTHPMSGIVVVNNTVVGNGTTGWGGRYHRLQPGRDERDRPQQRRERQCRLSDRRLERRSGGRRHGRPQPGLPVSRDRTRRGPGNELRGGGYNAVLGLSAAGEVQVHNTSAGTVHFIVDVNGYFR